jgi:hypothetical protein
LILELFGFILVIIVSSSYQSTYLWSLCCGTHSSIMTTLMYSHWVMEYIFTLPRSFCPQFSSWMYRMFL